MQKTRIDLLRHGEVQGGRCYRGMTDDALTDLGWQQMHKATSEFFGDLIISSPLIRCADFAKALSINKGITLIKNQAFQEINFGDWEGLTAHDIDTEALAYFYENPENFTPPNAESFIAFRTKILHAWESLCVTYSGQHVLLITHAGVIRVILERVFKLECGQGFQFEIGYSCVSSLCCFESTESVPFFQLLSHG